MIFGIPREVYKSELRVGLSPGGVAALVHRGASVCIEKGAGEDAHFTDADYSSVGGDVVFSADEVWGRPDVVLKVKLPSADELSCAREGQVVAGLLHLPISPPGILQKLLELKLTTLSYEEVVDGDGRFPVIHPLSELCGRMLPQVASRYLQSDEGGRGVLLSGTAGIPSAEVVILGCGAVGMHAAQAFYGIGAHVTVLDRDFKKLQRLDEILAGKVNTLIASRYNIKKVLGYADVLIGAIHAPFRLAEHIVTREMIRRMRPRAVAIDVSIDQGGCFETSRPTTLYDPVFVVEGVTHYCIPNMTSLVARTASHSITNAVLPFMFEVIEKGGFDEAVASDPVLASGCSIDKGKVHHPLLREILEGKPGSSVREEE